MSSMNAPYATMHDLPKYEKRADVVSAPWFKDQPPVLCGRGHDPEPYITCNSRTAPFATFHNTPEPAEYNTATLSEAQEKPVPSPSSVKGSQSPPAHKGSIPFGTSDDVQLPLQLNKSNVHLAPWDRDDIHYKVQPRFPHGEDAPHYTSAHAPYATDS